MEPKSFVSPFKAKIERLKEERKPYHKEGCSFILTPHMAVDFSRHFVDDEVIEFFLEKAYNENLRLRIHSLFSGEIVDLAGAKSSLHVAFRSPQYLHQDSFTQQWAKEKAKMLQWARLIRTGEYKGIEGRPITDIVHIGVGGSSWGPKLVDEIIDEEEEFKGKITLHFISNVDFFELKVILEKIDLETSLIFVCSKSFATQETLFNGEFLKNEYQRKWGDEGIKMHFFASTSHVQKAVDFGIPENQVFHMDDRVGGRFSIWSTSIFSLLLVKGTSFYQNFLDGAGWMDEHFILESFEKNIPFMLGALSWWSTSHMGIDSHAVVPYNARFRHFIPYCQQLIMESNGKSYNLLGKKLKYPSSVVFGDVGTSCQHTIFQYILQSGKNISSDFIGVIENPEGEFPYQDVLMSHFFSQLDFFFYGKSSSDCHKKIEGAQVSTAILLNKLDAFSLGALLALYEHRVFVEGVLMGVNSFDQWGVEESKRTFNLYYKDIQHKKKDPTHDLYSYYLRHRSPEI